MKSLFRLPVDDALGCLEHLMTVPKPAQVMIPSLVAMVVTWFIYVPIHELLHVGGCVIAGGEVTELHIQAHYFGNLLARWFDFVVVGGDYAGQVTGFDTGGNDWIYLATDFAPFVLSVIIGVPLLRLCTRRRRPLLFGVGFVVGFAPFYNLPGDYYEMASTIMTRALTVVSGKGPTLRFGGLRSDDIFTVIPDVLGKPASLGLSADVTTVVFSLLVVMISIGLGVLLAFATYGLGDLVARPFLGPAPRFVMPPRSVNPTEDPS